MNVQEILDSIHIGYEQATDTPSLNDEDGTIRMNLLQKAIRRWSKDNTTRWIELFDLKELGPIQAGVRDYSLGNTFYLDDAYYLEGSDLPLTVKPVHQLTGTTGRFVTVIGNKRDGYKLRLGWMPAANDVETGKKIIARVYREPFIPAATTDVLEMSDPEFAVAYVIGELFVNDEPNLYTKFNNDALLLLANMRDRNGSVAVGQFNGLESNGLGDIGIGG